MKSAFTSDDDEKICIIGGGYVGLVTAAWLAECGRTVCIVEIDKQKAELIAGGKTPIYEPGLEEVIESAVAAGRLTATTEITEGMDQAEIIIIAVGTPPLADGGADLSQVRSALGAVAQQARAGTVVVLKSTIPPGSARSLLRFIGKGQSRISLVSCPEFLREGCALADSRRPSRVVLGGDDRAAVERVARLFQHLDCPIILTDSVSAEMIKYGANAFLATKISFINELAQLCELSGGNIEDVATGLGSDPRIGRAFLNAGLGFGGSCFPKDVLALDQTAGYHGHSFWLMKAALEINSQQRRRFVGRIQAALNGKLDGRRIAVLGLTFKPDTDDMRQAPSLEIIRQLQDFGAEVTATDPVGIENARALLPSTQFFADPYECVEKADCVALVTEWQALLDLDWDRVAGLVHRKIVFDGRNSLDGDRLVGLGFTYHSVGRASRPSSKTQAKAEPRIASIGVAVEREVSAAV